MVSQQYASDPAFQTLFPLPTSTGNVTLPGPTHESAKLLVDKLKHNFVHNHVTFVPETGVHNHVVDDMLAVYALGGSAKLLENIYDDHQKYQIPLFKTGPVTEDNFLEHVGDHEYYEAFLVYFCNYLLSHTLTETLERFVFANEFNYVPDLDKVIEEGRNYGEMGTKKQPEMLNRFLAALLHPYIHLAYGVEFGIPATFAEGLAQTAIHVAHQTELIPPILFMSGTPLVGLSKLNLDAIASKAKGSRPPFFSLHQALFDDDALSHTALMISPEGIPDYRNVLKSAGDKIFEHANVWYDSWLTGITDIEEIESRIEHMVEEIIFGNLLWYGASGWAHRKTEERKLNADFFTMHFVTSSMFLPNLVLPNSNARTLQPPLSQRSRLLLLRSYLATCAGWYVARGRPALPIAEFYAATEKLLVPPPSISNPNPVSGEQKLFWTPGHARAVGMSPWARVWANTIVHPNEHLHKLVRACGAFANWYGGREKGYYAVGQGGLPGREVIDGTLPLRVAVITLERLGWAYEGGELEQWDCDGLF
ncbi:hypothetical protein OF83DRAFT_1144947 [Amylostereum chailletii]|nr:hypothetical protein OF83DRAFT_1144947 [Amylostereum chailletii]